MTTLHSHRRPNLNLEHSYAFYPRESEVSQHKPQKRKSTVNNKTRTDNTAHKEHIDSTDESLPDIVSQTANGQPSRDEHRDDRRRRETTRVGAREGADHKVREGPVARSNADVHERLTPTYVHRTRNRVIFNTGLRKSNGHKTLMEHQRQSILHKRVTMHPEGSVKRKSVAFKENDTVLKPWIQPRNNPENSQHISRRDEMNMARLSVEFREGTPEVFGISDSDTSDSELTAEASSSTMCSTASSLDKPYKSILKKTAHRHVNGHKTLSQQSSLPIHSKTKDVYRFPRKPRERCHSEPWERDPYRLPLLSSPDQTGSSQDQDRPSMVSGRYLNSDRHPNTDQYPNTDIKKLHRKVTRPNSEIYYYNQSARFATGNRNDGVLNNNIFMNQYKRHSHKPKTSGFPSFGNEGVFNCSSEFVETLKALKCDD